MIDKIQTELIKYLVDIFNEYGIPIEFQYSEDLDLVTAYRRSFGLRAENKLPPDWVKEIYDKNNVKYTTNLGLFNRTPLTRSDDYGNNNGIEVYCPTKTDEGDSVTLRDLFIGKISYSIKILCDSHDIADMIELIYTCSYYNRDVSLVVDFNLGNDIIIEDCKYNLTLNGIDDSSAVNSSDLRQIGFSIDLSGPFFIPFYKDGRNLLREIVVNTHFFNREPGIKLATPSAVNIDIDKVTNTDTIKNVSTFTKESGIGFKKTSDKLN